MKLNTKFCILLVELVLFIFFRSLGAEDPKEIIRKSDQRFNGEKSSISTMKMTIVRPQWTRTVAFKNWNKGNELNLTLINAPLKDRGQVFLKMKSEMWNWNPRISRMIKLPPSMMAQGWMGSDYTNDDLMKESSIVRDYKHRLMDDEIVDGYLCYCIELIPKDEANVVWGKIKLCISKENFLQLKGEYYDEEGFLVRRMKGSDIKEIGGRLLPARIELLPEEDPGHITILQIDDIEFNVDIKDQFFSQQNMKRVR